MWSRGVPRTAAFVPGLLPCVAAAASVAGAVADVAGYCAGPGPGLVLVPALVVSACCALWYACCGVLCCGTLVL